MDKMQFLKNRDIIISKFKLIILKSPSNALCEILREKERDSVCVRELLSEKRESVCVCKSDKFYHGLSWIINKPF